MQADKTTVTDLSIFSHEESLSIFEHINFARTVGGKEWLRYFISHPLNDLHKIKDIQQTLQNILAVESKWPETITNGTIMVVEKYFETPVSDIPNKPGFVSAATYRLLNAPDFSLVKYSVQHLVSFIKGLREIQQLLATQPLSATLTQMFERINLLLAREPLQAVLAVKDTATLSLKEILGFGYFFRKHFRHEVLELTEMHSRLDAWYSMAMAGKRLRFTFPLFREAAQPEVQVTQLFHPLLETPVAYDFTLAQQKNFLFLTGANMAGKSTFIKALGVAVYLAHLGMGVPAQAMELTVFDGLLSNIQVNDNIIKGESYFFNEVQRIRKTIEKINDGKKWLILIDELFKGTNVQDAMKCSTVVIEGLRKMQNTLFVLSTHLYEIGESLKQYPNIQFRYFETIAKDDQLIFSYHLKEGISNDRLGYLILKREGVVDMLQAL
jgi:DNA mismatch repair protein MutS